VIATVFLGPQVEGALAGAVISNGTVALGVNDTGQLNFTDDTRFVGVTYEATGNDGTRAGCECEGWGAGVADPAGNFSGFADNDTTGPAGSNVDLVSFTSTASTATSVVTIDDKLRVTHAFAPSPSTPNLYEIKVTLENIGTAALPDVRYTRLMDWDVEPTAFSEFVTVQRGTTPAPGGDLIRSNDNGFASPDPFADHSPFADPATDNADYVDKGPDDHGALFDFSFGALGVGEKKEFSIFYGATGTEAAANAAVSAAALELYSFGQPNEGQITGEPNTFIWGFKAVGGAPVIPPTLTLTPETDSNPVNTAHVLTAQLRDSTGNPVPGASIVFEVTGANPQSAVTATTGADGNATDTYTGTNTGDDTIKACLDNNGNGACDTGEVTDTATKTWTDAGPAPPTLNLTPETASNPVDTPHTVTAQLRDPTGNPVAGAAIVFVVTGANPQSAVTATTGADGNAANTYTGTTAGGDTITACVDANTNGACDGGEVTDTATKTWTPVGPPASVTDYTGDATVQYSDVATLSGTLKTTLGAGIPGKQLDFTLGTQTASASPTDADGAASTTLQVLQTPGSVTGVTAAFAGDSSYTASQTTEPFSITKEDCTLAYSGELAVDLPDTVGLAADLGEPDTSLGDRSGKTLVFTVTDASNASQTFSATTDAAGHASTTQALAAGVYTVTVAFAGDDFYEDCASAPATVTVAETPVAQKIKVIGAGSAKLDGTRLSFGFFAADGRRGLRGLLELQITCKRHRHHHGHHHGHCKGGRDHGGRRGHDDGGGPQCNHHFRAKGIDSLTATGNSATWTGTGRWDGDPGHTFTASVTDGGRGNPDTFEITIKDPSGAVVFTTDGPITPSGQIKVKIKSV
jgi:hypothetical protein